jgi:hypothetical protein
MTTLLKTTNEALADSCERNAQKEFGVFNICRFQYRATDGRFYYEILLKDN